MDASEFYSTFLSTFTPEGSNLVKKAYAYDAQEFTAGQWTKLMEEFLSDMLIGKGFKRTDLTKELGVGGGRIDYKWSKDGLSIFIEHENISDRVVEREVRNLLNSDGELRIFITYKPDENERQMMTEEILQKIRETKVGKNFEFLLIIGTDEYMNTYDAWETYRFFPTFDIKKL